MDLRLKMVYLKKKTFKRYLADFLKRQTNNFNDQEYEDQVNLCGYYLDSFLNALDYLNRERDSTALPELKLRFREIIM